MAHESLAAFNRKVARDVESLHDRLHAAGHAVTAEEAKFLWCVGWAAMADMVGNDEGREMLVAKARDLFPAAEADAKARAA